MILLGVKAKVKLEKEQFRFGSWKADRKLWTITKCIRCNVEWGLFFGQSLIYRILHRYTQQSWSKVSPSLRYFTIIIASYFQLCVVLFHIYRIAK